MGNTSWIYPVKESNCKHLKQHREIREVEGGWVATCWWCGKRGTRKRTYAEADIVFVDPER